jgi:hypothetical protein
MRYTQTHLLGVSGVTDTPLRTKFRATSIYDPWESLGGSQPTGHDELALFYNHYMVIGAKITVRYHLTSGHGGNQYVFLTPTDDTTTTNRNTKTELLNDPATKRLILNSERRHGTLSSYYSKKKVFGKSRDANLTASFGANPSENNFWQLATVNLTNTLAQSGVECEISITYDVLCSERKTIGTS